jgi:hypothetical protein
VVPGACESPQEASVGTGSFRFHCLACWEQELSIYLQVVHLAPGSHLSPKLLPFFPQNLVSAYSWAQCV